MNITFRTADCADILEKVARLEAVSGHSIETLTRMFLAGFEMHLPEDYVSKSELLMAKLRAEQSFDKLMKLWIEGLYEKTEE